MKILDGSFENRRLIIFPLYDDQSLRDLYETSGGILMLPIGETSREDYINKESRIYLLWLNYVVSLPITGSKRKPFPFYHDLKSIGKI